MASDPDKSVVPLDDDKDKDQKPAASTPTVVVISNAEPKSLIASLKGSGDTAPPAPEETDIIHTTELKKEHWATILRASGILKAWKGQLEGGKLHVNRAACAAIALKQNGIGDDDALGGIPEFEVSDDTYFETRESKTSLEREMTLKAFTESGIHAALSGGAQGIALGFGSDFSWAKGQDLSSTSQESASAIHSFYNRPQVIVHLDPDSFKLSPQCQKFFAKHKISCLMESEREAVLKRFFNRFGAILANRVTLGGRLCTTQELNSTDRAHVSQLKKNLESQLNAKVEGAGVGLDAGITHKKEKEHNERHVQHGESTRLTLETQGGNGLLASSIPDWSASVASYRYWRAIKQDQPQDLLPVLVEISEDTDLHGSISALSEYAKTVQQGIYRDRPNFLDIIAIAHYEVPKLPEPQQITSASGITPFLPFSAMPKFSVTLRFSKPSLVNRLQFSGHIEWDSKKHTTPSLSTLEPTVKNMMCSEKIPTELIYREAMQEEMTVEFDGAISEKDHQLNHKLKQRVNVQFGVVLEHFMECAEGPEMKYIMDPNLGIEEVVLEWLDIEVNSKMHWKLPISRKEPKKQTQTDKSLLSPPTAITGQMCEEYLRVHGVPDKKLKEVFKNLF